MVNMRDNGEITDKREFSHKAPLAGPPRAIKHGGKAVGDIVSWGGLWGSDHYGWTGATTKAASPLRHIDLRETFPSGFTG